MNIRDEKIKYAIDHIKDQMAKGSHPSYKELNKRFNIGTYGIKLVDLYPEIKVNYLNLKCKRPNNSFKQMRNELVDYIKKEVKNSHYPTRRFIERKFRLRLTPIFNGINELYKLSGINYKQKNSQELKNMKAEALLKVVLGILPKLNLKLIKYRTTHERGIDILAEDTHKNLIGIEIKAHHKYEPIKNRNMEQLKRFIINERLDQVILITTSSKISCSSNQKNISIIDYESLKCLCDNNQLRVLEFIREKSIHHETMDKENKRKMIIQYAKDRIKKGKDINHRLISKDLHIGLRTYFKSINEIYDKLGILPPISIMGEGRRSSKKYHYREKVINKMLDYIKQEVLKGHYPNGFDIGKEFGIKHIWDFVTMTELYERLGLEPYQKRKIRK